MWELSTERVAYMNMWNEDSRLPLTTDRINDAEAWRDVHTQVPTTRPWAGAGIMHVTALADLLGRPVEVTTPQFCSMIVSSGFGTLVWARLGKPNLRVVWEPDTAAESPGPQTMLWTSNVDECVELGAHDICGTSFRLYMPLPAAYYGLDFFWQELTRPRVAPSREVWEQRRAGAAIISNRDNGFRMKCAKRFESEFNFELWGGTRRLGGESDPDRVAELSSAWFDPRLPAFLGKHYNAYMCFENTSRPGYHTEKIFHALRAGVVPVYWGDPHLGRVINPAAFLDVRVDGLDETIERLKLLFSDYEKYCAFVTTPLLLPDSLAHTRLPRRDELASIVCAWLDACKAK